MQLIKEAQAWVKRKSAPDKIVSIVPVTKNKVAVLCYHLYTTYEENPDYLGRILFDVQGGLDLRR
jgi:hypothetical protein